MSKGGGQVEMPDPSEYIPLVQAQADTNRIDQFSPFGSITYNSTAPDPLSFSDWLGQNPAPATSPVRSYGGGRDDLHPTLGYGNHSTSNYDPNKGYQDYLSNFNQNHINDTTANFEFSPELQSLFDTQFSPDAYQNYATDYMDRYTQLLDPYRQDETDRFQQSMFDRGIPEGSEVYKDNYRPIGDQRSRADLMAAQTAQGVADQRLMQDYNRLMAAMGGSQIPVAPVDVMGPANMALNANIANQQNQSSIWDSLPGLAGAYMVGAPDSSWLWS